MSSVVYFHCSFNDLDSVAEQLAGPQWRPLLVGKLGRRSQLLDPTN